MMLPGGGGVRGLDVGTPDKLLSPNFVPVLPGTGGGGGGGTSRCEDMLINSRKPVFSVGLSICRCTSLSLSLEYLLTLRSIKILCFVACRTVNKIECINNWKPLLFRVVQVFVQVEVS